MNECATGGDCIESSERPGWCAKCLRDMPVRSADPDADRPCSCEESERLKARVRELEADIDRMRKTHGDRDEWVKAAQRHDLIRINSESDARALREKIERAVALIEPWLGDLVVRRKLLEALR